MRLDEYARCDGLELARLVRAGEVTPRELAAMAQAAIAAINPQINAVIGRIEPTDPDFAGIPADAPFAGVPFLIKDLVLHARGVPCDMGSRLVHGGFVAPADSDLMQRFRHAGFITLGRTNTPEMGFNASTEPLLYGPTRNPWNPAHSSGGSSGGSAAAVAAGIVPVAHANDGGGSIRIPASCCGLVGLKPTRGRVPVGPDFGDALHGLGIELVVSRTVRDTAAALDAVEGPGCGDRYVIPRPRRPYLAEIARKPKRLRIALSSAVDSHSDPADPACVRVLELAAARCRELGHRVVEAAPVYDADVFHRANLIYWCSFCTAAVAGTAQMLGRQPSPDNLEASLWANYQHGLTLKALDLELADVLMNQVCRTVAPFFERYDVLLTPVLGVPPLKLGVLNANDPRLDAQGWYDHLFRFMPYTALYNMTGQPAISLPLGQSPDGLPIGVQAVARYGGEATLLALAAQLEEAMPWRGRIPPIHVSRTNGESHA
ncbi:MAG: amidase [Gammaproteobacteria bacterium]|nr:MAG: amidase [Gammaproteobacteria bacterium]